MYFTLHCCQIGEPVPEVTWYKGKKPVKKTKDKRIKTEFDKKSKVAKLEIKEAVIEDSGEYVVKLANEVSTTAEFQQTLPEMLN